MTNTCMNCENFNYFVTPGGYVILCDRLRKQEGYQIYKGFEKYLYSNFEKYPSCEDFEEVE